MGIRALGWSVKITAGTYGACMPRFTSPRGLAVTALAAATVLSGAATAQASTQVETLAPPPWCSGQGSARAEPVPLLLASVGAVAPRAALAVIGLVLPNSYGASRAAGDVGSAGRGGDAHRRGLRAMSGRYAERGDLQCHQSCGTDHPPAPEVSEDRGDQQARCEPGQEDSGPSRRLTHAGRRICPLPKENGEGQPSGHQKADGHRIKQRQRREHR